MAVEEFHKHNFISFCPCRRSVLVHCMTSVRRSTLTIQNFILTSCSPSSRWQKLRWKSRIQIHVHVSLSVSPLFSCCCWERCWHRDDSCKVSTNRLHSYISSSQQLSVVNVIPNGAMKWSQWECCHINNMKYSFVANGDLNKYCKYTGDTQMIICVTLVFSEDISNKMYCH
jgi:hypothetical protein